MAGATFVVYFGLVFGVNLPILHTFPIMNKSENIQSGFPLDETKSGHMLQPCFTCNGLSAWGQTRSNLKLSEVQLMQIPIPKHLLFMSKSHLLLVCLTWLSRDGLSVHLHCCLDTAPGPGCLQFLCSGCSIKTLLRLVCFHGFHRE